MWYKGLYITIEKQLNGYLLLTCIDDNDVYYKQRYMGYTRKEAIREFVEMIKGQYHNPIVTRNNIPL